MLRSYIAADAKPTIEVFNQLNAILPKGIYSGGGVYQGPGRQVTIEAFTAKAFDGFTIVGDTENVEVPAYPLQSWALVLYAKSWAPGDSPKQHHLQFRVIPWVSTSLPGYTGNNQDPDLRYFILFAKIDALSNSIRILPQEINTAIAEKINLRNLASTQLISGTDNFKGPDGAIVYHNLGHTKYKVHITPSETPNVGIGDMWVEKDSRFFTVRTVGDTKTTFDWSVTASQASLGLDAQNAFGSRFGKALLKDPIEITHNEASVRNYIVIASNFGIQETIQPIPHVTHYDSRAVISTTFPFQTIPLVWQIVSNVGRPDLIFDEFIMTSTHGEYSYGTTGQAIAANSLRVFAYPEQSYSNPIVKVSNYAPDKIKVSFDAQVTTGTKVRLAIFRNPGAYPNGMSTGTNVVEVVHNLDLDKYVPFIAFTDILGFLDGYNVEVGRNSFRIILPPGVSVTFNWLLVPSFTN